jgi:hypothetical protein
MVEVKEVVGFPRYTVSIDGEVVRIKTGRILKRTKQSWGVSTVRLIRSSYFATNISVHNLIWIAFKGDIPRGSQVTYIDGDKENIHLDNLTLKPEGAMATGMVTHPNHRLKPHEVVRMRSLHHFGRSITDLAKRYKVSVTTVFNVVNFRTYKRVGGGEKW